MSFLESGRFLTKYGHDNSSFCIQNPQKGHPIDFFGLKYIIVLTKATFFLTKYGHDYRGFFLHKLKKNGIGTQRF